MIPRICETPEQLRAEKHLRTVARREARRWFTNGRGLIAARLVLIDDDGANLGGWSELVIQQRLLDMLCAAVAAAKKGEGQ